MLSVHYKMWRYSPRGLSPQGGSRPSGRIPSCSPKSGAVSVILNRPLGIRMFAALLLFASAVQVLAKDVSMEQSAVQYARQEFEKAEVEHEADLEQAARTRKALEPLKKQFEQEQKKASLSAKKKQQAKARLEQAQQALDRAWKQ